ncbi:MAG TPA: hypothetical protein EYP60_03525 [bacterium (Candidatus Stahlbacteria)]|nr:hypothetical protein [Candidatus Stahlbacteria bacterium]
MSNLMVGTAKVDITPKVGVDLSGYVGRSGTSNGVHDNLYANAVVLQTPNAKLVIVSCDICGFGMKSADAIRAKISNDLNIDKKSIAVIATHTHSAPGTLYLRNCGQIDENWKGILHQKVVEATLAADKNLKNARIGSAIGEVVIGKNRRNPNGPIDSTLGVLYIEDKFGSPICMLINCACHPVVLTEDNLLISADYPFYLQKKLTQVYSDKMICIFTNGACGDIDPIERGSFELAEKYGNMLADEAVKICKQIKTTSEVNINVKSTNVRLYFKDAPSLIEAQKILLNNKDNLQKLIQVHASKEKIKIAQTFVDWAEELLLAVKQGKLTQSVDVEVQVMQIGDTLLVTFPGELFCEIGLNIKGKLKYKKVFIIGYANGNIGYIPAEQAYEGGGYEVEDAHKYYGLLPLRSDAARIITEEVLRLSTSIRMNLCHREH